MYLLQPPVQRLLHDQWLLRNYFAIRKFQDFSALSKAFPDFDQVLFAALVNSFFTLKKNTNQKTSLQIGVGLNQVDLELFRTPNEFFVIIKHVRIALRVFLQKFLGPLNGFV